MIEMWKEKLREFIFEKDAEGHYNVDTEYIMGFWDIFSNLVPKNGRKRYPRMRLEIIKEIKRYEQEHNSEMVRNKIMEVLEVIVEQSLNEGVMSFIWPTVIAESNLNMGGEGIEKEEEIWRVLYLVYTGVGFGRYDRYRKYGRYIVNVDNIGDAGRKWLWKTLITSATIMGRNGLDFKPIMERLKIRFDPAAEPFFSTLALLQFWAIKGLED